MKKSVAMLLALTMLFAFTACGESKQLTAAKEALEMLPALEELTVEDEALVIQAQDAISALTDKEKTALGDISWFDPYPEEMEYLKAEAALIAQCVGSWRNLYPTEFTATGEDVERFTLNADGTCDLDGVGGTWEADVYNNTFYAQDGKGNYLIGGLSPSEFDGQRRLQNEWYIYVAEEDYDRLADGMFVTVNLTTDNFSDYIGEMTLIGDYHDEWGDRQGDTYFFPSRAYADGLVLYSVSEDFAYEARIAYDYHDGWGANEMTLTFSDPFAMLFSYDAETYELLEITRVKGTLTFIRADYVLSNEVSKDGYYRVLKLADGYTIEDYHFASYYWDNSDAVYDDWKY